MKHFGHSRVVATAARAASEDIEEQLEFLISLTPLLHMLAKVYILSIAMIERLHAVFRKFLRDSTPRSYETFLAAAALAQRSERHKRHAPPQEEAQLALDDVESAFRSFCPGRSQSELQVFFNRKCKELQGRVMQDGTTFNPSRHYADIKAMRASATDDEMDLCKKISFLSKSASAKLAKGDELSAERDRSRQPIEEAKAPRGRSQRHEGAQ
jgi:hypothetical protein